MLSIDYLLLYHSSRFLFGKNSILRWVLGNCILGILLLKAHFKLLMIG